MYPLPHGFEWSTCDMKDETTAREVQALLEKYYVENIDSRFRLAYTKDFLQWALSGPNAVSEWVFGVRATETKKLLAFITGIRINVRVMETPIEMGEVNFLCVHPKLRHKKLAPLMIRELTRRINLHNIWKAVYTGGVHRPDDVASTRYWHRPLNVPKLDATGFSPCPSLRTAVRMFTPRGDSSTRPMTSSDVPWVTRLLNENNERFQLVQIFSEEEVAHMFLPRPNIIESFVFEQTDFVSFYSLPSTVSGTDEIIQAAWSYYIAPGQKTYSELLKEGILWAHRKGYDVYNSLSIMDATPKILEDLKFQPGNGFLHYYFFNHESEEMKQEEVGLLLV